MFWARFMGLYVIILNIWDCLGLSGIIGILGITFWDCMGFGTVYLYVFQTNLMQWFIKKQCHFPSKSNRHIESMFFVRLIFVNGDQLLRLSFIKKNI